MCEKFTDGDWIEAKDQSDAGIRLVQTGNIGIAEYLDKPNNKKWISEETFERLHCEEVYPNDILISRLPEPAGRACIMPNLGTKMITAVDCTIVRPSKDVSANFLLQYLSSQSYFDEVNTCLAGGTRQRISRGNLAGFDVPIPLDKTEQDVIGNFLCTLDNLITLHQRKYDKLHVLKKAMLEKMFPKNGSSVPEIRFKGFTDAWEQRKLGEISEIKTGPFGSILHADDYVSEGVPIITTEHFKTGSLPQNASGLPQVSEVDYKRLSAYTLNNGDIVFSRVGSVDINALVTPFQRNWLFSGRVLRVRPEIDVLPQFLHTRLETESIKNDICARAVGQTMPSINTEILKATQLVLPTSMAEQKQIGLYFAKLDHLITLHQRELEKLQNIKKSMLEKMFV